MRSVRWGFAYFAKFKVGWKRRAHGDSLWPHLGTAVEQPNFVIVVKDSKMAPATHEFVVWTMSIGHKVYVVTRRKSKDS